MPDIDYDIELAKRRLKKAEEELDKAETELIKLRNLKEATKEIKND